MDMETMMQASNKSHETANEQPRREKLHRLGPQETAMCIDALSGIHDGVLEIGQHLADNPGSPRFTKMFHSHDWCTVNNAPTTERIRKGQSSWMDESGKPACMPLERARELAVEGLVHQHGSEDVTRDYDDYVVSGTAGLWVGEFEGKRFKVQSEIDLHRSVNRDAEQMDGCQFVALNVAGRNFLKWAVGLRTDWEKTGREFLLQLSPTIGPVVLEEQPSFARLKELIAADTEAVLDFIKPFAPLTYKAITASRRADRRF